MPRKLSTLEDIKFVLNKFNEIPTPELLAYRYNLDVYDVFTIIFNYRMSFKDGSQMTNKELQKLLQERPQTFKDRNSNLSIA